MLKILFTGEEETRFILTETLTVIEESQLV